VLPKLQTTESTTECCVKNSWRSVQSNFICMPAKF